MMQGNLDASQAHDVAFVFNDLRNYKSLVAAFLPGVEVHVLDAGGNGLEQIAAVLAGRSGIGALHIVGHGAPGMVQLGSLLLDAQGLASHAPALAGIGSALVRGGDILLYGCNVAADAIGASFVGQLARATGADVAASTDPTGGAGAGADWILEYHQGEVVGTIAFDAASVHRLDTLLALPAAGVHDVTEDMNKSGSGSFISGFTLTSTHTFEPDPTEGADGLYFFSTADALTSTVDATLTVSADALNLGSFDLTALDFEKYPGGYPGEYTFTITGYKPDSTTVVTTFRSERDAPGYSTLPDFSGFTGIVKFDVRIVSTGSDAYAHGYPVSNWTFDGFSIAQPRTPNTAPVFVGASTLEITQGDATDTAPWLQVNDPDGYQTLTWTQQSAPSHGTLSFSGATASGGGSAIEAGGSILYTPTAGYAGTDQFTVRVSDGFTTVARTITVTVKPDAPSAPDLASGSDSGTGSTDNITNATTLSFSGSGAAGDSASTVRVFIDRNGNGSYDAGTDTTSTATMSNGSWSASLAASGVPDGTYNVYAFSTNSGLTGALGAPLAVTLDRTAPVLATTSNKSSLKETATVTFTFSEDPGASFAAGDIAVTGGTLSGLAGSGTTRTALFTPTPDSSGTAGITIAAGGYTDAAGNSGSGSTLSIAYDTKAPTLAITSDAASLKAGGTATITFTFSEDPLASFTDSDIAVSGGTLGPISGTGLVRTATFTPAAGTNGGVASITVAAGSYADAAGNGGGSGATPALVFDTQAPAAPSGAVLATGSDTGFSASDGITSDTTPTLSGSAEAGAAITLYGSDGTTVIGSGTADGGGNWTVTTDALSAGTHSITVRATDAAGNQGPASVALAVTVDASAPTVSISSDVASLRASETATITFTFSEDPGSSFSADDIAVSGGTLGALSGSGNIRTAVFTPAPASAGTASITIASGSYTDVAGNGGGAGTTPVLAYDTTAPTLAITSSASALRSGQTATITFTFSDDPGATFVDSDIVVSGGTLGPIAGTGLVRTATFTPDANTASGTASITVAAGAYADADGTAGLAGATPALVFDTLAPTLAITTDRSALKAGESATITFTFSEDPGASFEAADITVSGGTLGPLSGTGLVRTATFAPDADTNGGTASITVAAGSYVDGAGNDGGAGASPALAFDTRAPAAPSVPDLAALSDTGASDSDNVTADTTPTLTGTAEDGATVTLYDGATAVGSATASGGSWAITPDALSHGSHSLVAVVTDPVGNVSTASGALALTVDSAAPAVTITSDMAALIAGGSAEITFTFSEDPGGTFGVDDIEVEGGTLGALAGSGLVRTATFTPAAGTNVGTASITVTAGSYADTAGNAGSAGTSPALVFDTLAPTLAITSDVPALRSGETATITFTFSEDPGASFDAGDITVAGGTLGMLAGTGAVRTAVFTPTAGIDDGTAAISVAGGSWTDAAGNAGGTGLTPALVFDTLAPAQRPPPTWRRAATAVLRTLTTSPPVQRRSSPAPAKRVRR